MVISLRKKSLADRCRSCIRSRISRRLCAANRPFASPRRYSATHESECPLLCWTRQQHLSSPESAAVQSMQIPDQKLLLHPRKAMKAFCLVLVQRFAPLANFDSLLFFSRPTAPKLPILLRWRNQLPRHFAAISDEGPHKSGSDQRELCVGEVQTPQRLLDELSSRQRTLAVGRQKLLSYPFFEKIQQHKLFDGSMESLCFRKCQ
jgi:hypothetical protein